MRRAFVVSAEYIEWAHGPGAESGQSLAAELCALAVEGRRFVVVPASRLDLLREIAAVAEMYEDEDGTHQRARRVLARARQFLSALELSHA